MIAKILKVFAFVWTILIVILVLLSIVGMYLTTGSIIETWKWVTETFSPFNLWNALLLMILLIPTFVAVYFADRLSK